jgi:hypothetical protein
MIGHVTLLLLASLAGAAPARLEIVSASLCPTADMVRAALDTLGGASPQRGAVVTVRDAAGGVSLTFQWQDADAADVRVVAAPAECQQRARAAAVVIGSWLGALPASPAAPPAASSDATNMVVAPAAAVAPAPERRWWLGAGLGAGVGGGVAPGARVEVARGRASGRGAGVLAAVQATLPRSLTVGGGTSSWIRPALGVAAFFAWPVGATAISGDLGPVAAATVAWGSGYPSNRSDQGASLGVCAGIRLQVGSGSSRPWLELRAIRWLTTHRLRFDPAASGPITAELPTTEGFFTLGWSLPIF